MIATDEVPFTSKLNMNAEGGFEIVIEQVTVIFVKTLTGKEIECDYSPDTTVNELKYINQKKKEYRLISSALSSGACRLINVQVAAPHKLKCWPSDTSLKLRRRDIVYLWGRTTPFSLAMSVCLLTTST